MGGTVVGKSMSIGFPGDYSRNGDYQVTSRVVNPDDAAGPDFGDPVIINSDTTGGSYSKGGATLAMTNFAGVAIREVKTFETWNPAPSLGNYAPGKMCDVLTRGSVNVVVNGATAPQAHGKVYVRTVAGADATPVGGFEAAAADDGGTTVEITNAEWTTGVMTADANGYNVAEITLRTKNAA